MDDSQVILYAKQIEMDFPGVKALDHVDLRIRRGEVHSIMGENGAGKSTIIKCITGVFHKTGGDIIFNHKKISPKSTSEAQELGISTVYQEVNLCENLTVAENIFIGREPMKWGSIQWKKMNADSTEILKKFDISIDVTKTLNEYSIAIQQMIAIARAVDISAQVLILDEPTSSLDEIEVKRLFTILRRLKEKGMAIIFVSHFLDQIYEISDRITILRNGKLIGEYEAKYLQKVELVNLMVGKEMEELSAIHKVKISDASKRSLLEAKNIGVKGKVEHIDLHLFDSEIVGFAGLLGSGRTEVGEMLFGIHKITQGHIKIKGQPVKLHTTREAINKRIAFCPEDRKSNGIIADLSIRENIILALQAHQGLFNTIPKKEQSDLAEKYIKLLGIATTDAEKRIGELSGGNQQKVILARWLATEPELLILDEPTRGIDVGAKADIQKLTVSLCEKGMSVIFISSEIEEVIRCSNRVVVMRDRKKVSELDASKITQKDIINTIAGGGNRDSL
jgi:galactofuranose transport system ATP-binding protein